MQDVCAVLRCAALCVLRVRRQAAQRSAVQRSGMRRLTPRGGRMPHSRERASASPAPHRLRWVSLFCQASLPWVVTASYQMQCTRSHPGATSRMRAASSLHGRRGGEQWAPRLAGAAVHATHARHQRRPALRPAAAAHALQEQ